MKDQKNTMEELTDELNKLRSAVSLMEASLAQARMEAEALLEFRGRYEAMEAALGGYINICSPTYEIEFMNRQLIERTGGCPIGGIC
jgi:hypothetical protein